MHHPGGGFGNQDLSFCPSSITVVEDLKIENLDFTELCNEQSRLNMRTQKVIAPNWDKENQGPNRSQCHEQCCIVGEQAIEEEEVKGAPEKAESKKRLNMFMKKKVPPKLQNLRKWKTERKLKIEFD